MKTYIILLSLCFIAFGSISATAQCDPNVESPIRCGYYTEAYQDGANDARSNRNSDYRRYKNKYENKYESYYRQGYQAGYESVRPTVQWTYSQRSAYDAGYNIGLNDRRSGGQNRQSEAMRGGYDVNIGLYFQQGYDDGFSGRPRQYDFPINQNPNFPPIGTGQNGTASWAGRVDGRANIIIRGNQIRTEDASGSGLQITGQNIYGSLPRRATTVSASRREGRGSVNVIQQPNRNNDYTAIIQIDDPRSGSDNYRVDISWTGGSFPGNEPYQSGSVSWRGRVDQRVNITIDGADVVSEDVAGTGLSGVYSDVRGYLAHRAGAVNVRKRNGRGMVTVIQQPSFDNGFTAVIQIFDPNNGADDYELEITW